MTTKAKQPKLAAIYVRVSSEHQAEKVSPEEQEIQCKKLAEEMELVVVNTYRDTQKYRVGSRLFEPSGTRTDRPAFTRMLQDAAEGKFDTMIAWREDRFYRGLKAMIIFLETIQDYKINVFLARETFDQKMAPVKAWVGQMELDGMKERMTMGVKARLRSGKANTGQDRYGYQRVGEVIEIVEEEAEWVRKIFEWYNDRVPIMEIRRRLITADAPQKGSSRHRRILWARSTIQGILKGAKDYATGVKIQTRDSEVFEIPIPPIISPESYQAFIEKRENNKKHKTNHVNRDYLLLGKIYCACNRRWQARTNSYTRKNRAGEKVDRKTLYGAYYCPQCHAENIHPDCPRTIGVKKADDIVWEKLYTSLHKPDILIDGARRFVGELQQVSDERTQKMEKLQKDLDANMMERQWVIAQARKRNISEEDMQYQLSSLSLQELEIRKDMAQIGEINQFAALSHWEDKLREYLETLRLGLESINATPQTDEEWRENFELKRRFIQLAVAKVVIDKNRDLKVWFKLKPLMTAAGPDDFREIKSVGTYTHTPASPARRRRSGSCG